MSDYKRYAVALAFVMAFVWSGSRSVNAAGAMYDWCYNSCSETAGCDIECEADGGGTTTCGEYDDGPANGWCDGDTCEDICSPWTPPSYECWAQGVPTDCYGYDDYAQCGDGVCAFYGDNETCDTCSADCGTCPPIVCGDYDCEDFESYRNCPNDCETPNPQYKYCGDGTCDPGEDSECGEDCDIPGEFCDGWDYFCPTGWQCIGDQCIREEYIFDLDGCNPPDNEHSVEWCPVGYNCRQAVNPFSLEKFPACVPFHWQ